MAEKSGRAARKTKIGDKIEHPYTEFEGTKLWRVIDKALDDLVENRDLTETTDRRYIVGYLCKRIVKSNIEKTRG